MYSTITIHLLFWFILATSFFYLALQQQFNYLRQTLTILHILSIAICLRGDNLGLVPFAHVWATFIFGITLHTTSILVVKKKTIKLQPSSFIQQLRTTFQTWTNFRQLPLDHEDGAIPAQNSTSRGIFTILKCAHIVALYLGNHLVTSIISKTLRPLTITLQDFAPAKQGLMPPLTHRDLSLRAVMSVHWIWSTYAVLTGSHAILSLLFVTLLRWDQPAQWPALFGSIAEAYSLRRFWGVFWHRLHVAVYEAYMPSFLLRCHNDHHQDWHAEQRYSGYRKIRKGGRALWMFLSSAFSHAAVHWLVTGNGNTAQQVKFFLSNYALCLVETVARQALKGKVISNGSLWARLFGYAWVLAVLFAIVPAWQYSLIYTAAGY